MLSTAIVAVSALLFAFASSASASPTLVPRTCSPSFSADQTIYVRPPITDIGVYAWTPTSYSLGAQITLQTQSVNDAFSQAEFSILTQSNGLYTIIPAFRTTTSLALTAGEDGALSFELAPLISIATQQFSITCDTCSEDGPDKCTIENPASGQCIVGTNSGDTLTMGDCDNAGVYSFLGTISSSTSS